MWTYGFTFEGTRSGVALSNRVFDPEDQFEASKVLCASHTQHSNVVVGKCVCMCICSLMYAYVMTPTNASGMGLSHGVFR